MNEPASIVKVWLVSEGVPPPPPSDGTATGSGYGVRTVIEIFDCSESPALLRAMRVNVYSVPFVSPVNVQERFVVFVQPDGAVTEGEDVKQY